MKHTLPLDGLPYADVEPFIVLDGAALSWEEFSSRHPDANLCERCHRVYPADVTFDGAPSERCIHCLYEDLLELKGDPEFASEIERLAEDHLALSRYLRRYAPSHDRESCCRRPRCILCDALQAGAPLNALHPLREWLEDRGLTPRKELRRPRRADFKDWPSLSESARVSALETVRPVLRLALEVGHARSGHLALLNRENDLEFVVIPGRGPVSTFLLATTPLSGQQATALGAVPSTLSPEMPWAGFDLEYLSSLWRWQVRLPTEREWRLACEPSAGPVAQFVCDGAPLARVIREGAPVNALGLTDLAGQVAELLAVQEVSVGTIGGSAATPRARLEALSRPAPKDSEARTLRCVLEQHPIRPLGGLLPSLVPPFVGVRLAASLPPV